MLFIQILLGFCSVLLSTTFAQTPLGGTCSSDIECADNARCTNGICGGDGGYCSDGGDCANGLNCLDFQCTSLSPQPLGGDCSDIIQCPANARCTNGICGGDGGYCSNGGDCASGLNCLQSQCTSLSPQPLGGDCSDIIQCPANARCTNGICGGDGGFCLDAGTDCANGLNCLQSQCTSLSPQPLGGDCTDIIQCPANARCTEGICGGDGGFCLNAGTDCASGHNCLQSQCTPLPPRALGASCSDIIQCPANARCTDGICGGSGGFCVDGQTDCASGMLTHPPLSSTADDGSYFRNLYLLQYLRNVP
jgi:hypothetical protein